MELTIAFLGGSLIQWVGYLDCKEVESEYLHKPRVYCKVERNQLSQDRLYRQEDRPFKVTQLRAFLVLEVEHIDAPSGSHKLKDKRDTPDSCHYSKLPDVAVVLLLLVGLASIPEVHYSLVDVEHDHHSQTKSRLLN